MELLVGFSRTLVPEWLWNLLPFIIDVGLKAMVECLKNSSIWILSSNFGFLVPNEYKAALWGRCDWLVGPESLIHSNFIKFILPKWRGLSLAWTDF